MNKKLNKIVTVTIALMMTLSFAGCAKKATTDAAAKPAAQAAAKETTLDAIKKSGKLIVGTSADYPPYEFHKNVNGKDEIVGFDITIAQEIAKDLGVQLEIKDMKFDGLLAALQTGNINMIIAGMVPTEERAKSVDFSKIYYKSIQSVMVRTADKDKIKTIDDLKGKKVGAQKSTTQETIAKEQMANSELKSLGKITDLVLELKNNKIDALVIELPVATSYASKNPDIAVANVQIKNEDKGSAVAVQKNSPELVDAINKTLDKLMQSNSIDKFVNEANEMVE